MRGCSTQDHSVICSCSCPPLTPLSGTYSPKAQIWEVIRFYVAPMVLRDKTELLCTKGISACSGLCKESLPTSPVITYTEHVQERSSFACVLRRISGQKYVQARWVIKLEKAVERQEWLPMPLTHSAHPWEESERFSRDFLWRQRYTLFQPCKWLQDLSVWELLEEKKNAPRIHALTMRLVLMNTSIWQCRLDGTHATDGWAGLSLPAVYTPRWHLAQKLRGRTDISLVHSLNALLVPKEREGERGILSMGGELGLRDRGGWKAGIKPQR